MRSGQKEDVYALCLQGIPTECLQRIAAIAIALSINAMRTTAGWIAVRIAVWIAVWIKDVRVNIIQPSRTRALAFARKQDRLLHLGMAHEQPSQFESGITGSANNSGLDRGWHQARIPSSFTCSNRALRLLLVMISSVSSPATVPTTSSHASASRATATGCALPGVVLITSRFCALRTSRTNSLTRRETAGIGSDGASPLRRM